MGENRLEEKVKIITEYLNVFNEYINNKEEKEERFAVLAILYIQLFEDNYLEADNLLAFIHILEFEYGIGIDDYEHFIKELMLAYQAVTEENTNQETDENGTHTFSTTSQSGYVYILINPSMEGLVKIGMTTREPETRTQELSSATGVPTPFILVYKEFFSDCYLAEQMVHAILEEKQYRVSENREFFSVPVQDAIHVVQQVKQYFLEHPIEAGEIHQENDDYFLDDSPEDFIEDLIEKGEDALHGYGDTLQNFEKAFKYLEKAGKLGSSKAYLIMGKAYIDPFLRDHGLKISANKALKYFEKGATLSRDIHSNHCIAEMATLFSGKYDYLGEPLHHALNAGKCWKKYLFNLSLSNCDANDRFYLRDFIVFYLNSNQNSRYLDEFFERALQVINWFKNDLYNSANYNIKNYSSETLIHNESLIVWRFLKGCYSFDEDFLEYNEEPFMFNRYLQTRILNVQRAGEKFVAFDVFIERGKLHVDDVIGFHTAGSSDYSRILQIKCGHDNLQEIESNQECTLVVEDTFNDLKYLEYLIKETENNVSISLAGEYFYSPVIKADMNDTNEKDQVSDKQQDHAFADEKAVKERFSFKETNENQNLSIFGKIKRFLIGD